MVITMLALAVRDMTLIVRDEILAVRDVTLAAAGNVGGAARLAAGDIAVRVPNPAPALVPGLATPVNTIISWGKWLVMVMGVIGLLICGGQMAIGRRNRHSFAADGAAGIPWVLGGISLATIAASVVTVFLH